MDIILYLLGYFAFFLLMFMIFFKCHLPLTFLEKCLVFSVSLIPLGKLIYLPIPGLIGLKFSFIFGSLVALLWFMFKGVHVNQLLLIAILILPLFSLIYIENYDWLFMYQLNEEQMDSTLLRFVSIVVLVFYCSVVYSAIAKNKVIIPSMAKFFILGTLFASFVGIFISYFVFKGVLGQFDISPISAGVHIVNIGGFNFYRFNPGANVNEFSMLLAYAIFLIPFTKFKNKHKFYLVSLFLLLEFATLTRASWLALVISFVFAICFSSDMKKIIKWVLVIFGPFLLAFTFLYHTSDQIKYLVVSRLSLNIGASGYERLDKFIYVIDRLTDNTFRFFFGFGWATNMYVHNVYLQIAYEVGLIGLVLFVGSIFLYNRNLFLMERCTTKAVLVAIVSFIAIVASMHHILYHIQTWFMLAFVAAVSTSYMNEEK